MTLRRLSPSQIATFRDCQRKWAWSAIAKIPQQQNIYAQVGDATHRYLEAYLRDGTPPDIGEELRLYNPTKGVEQVFYPGRIALSGVKHLPVPGTPGLLTESAFDLDTYAGPITGRIDLQYLDRDGVRVIHDHKTTSDFKWALSPEELEHDPQSVIYSAWAAQHYDVERIRVKWLYMLRDVERPRSRLVQHDLPLSIIDKHIRPLLETGEEMQRIVAAQPNVLDLPPTIATCDKYGGCSFQNQCNLTPQERWRSIMSRASLKETLLSRKNIQAAQPAPAPHPEQIAAPAPAIPAPSASSMLDRIRAQRGASKGVNPPEQHAVLAPAVEQSAPAVEQPARGRPKTPIVGGRPSATPTVSPATPRPPMALTPTPPAPAEVPAAAEPEIENGSDFVLLIDCAPVKLPSGENDIMALDDIVVPLAEALAQEHEVASYRLISGEYGIAQNLLMTKVDAFLRGGGLPTGTVVCAFTGGLLTRDTLEIFSAHASMVLKGAA